MKGKYRFQPTLLVIFSILMFSATPSFAGVLKIKTQTTVQTTGDQLHMAVTLTNEGTAIAYNLQVHLELLGKTLDSKLEPQLDPAGSNTFVFAKSVRKIKAGRYPLTVYVDFHDANQYPFSALSGMTFSVGPDVNSDLAVIGNDIDMDKAGELSLNIKNMGTGEKNILATLVLPKELSTPTPQVSFLLPPRSQKDLDFEIRNFSALPGADYPVFCYFEYDLDSIHHTAVCSAVIKIIHQENLFRQYRWLWMGIAGALIMALLTLIIKNRMKIKE
jgi:CARDB